LTAHRPRKRFGQHFLHDQGLLQRMVRAIDPAPTDAVLEIGPGEGALTAPLLARLERLHVVELDRDLAAALPGRVPHPERLAVHAGDALEVDLARFAPAPGALRVVGNLPYNISTPLIFHLLDQLRWLRDMHFLLQKEVVERLAAAPGTGDYGRLSVMVQYHCRVEKLFTVGPGAFRPPPRVDSAFVRLVPHRPLPWPAADEAGFAELVRRAFTQRRKTLRRSLRGLAGPTHFAAAGIDPERRPETLTVAEFVALADALAD